MSETKQVTVKSLLDGRVVSAYFQLEDPSQHRAYNVLISGRGTVSTRARLAIRRSAETAGVPDRYVQPIPDLVEILASPEWWDTSKSEVIRESLRRYGQAIEEAEENGVLA